MQYFIHWRARLKYKINTHPMYRSFLYNQLQCPDWRGLILEGWGRANIGGGGVIAIKGTHDLGMTTWEPIVYSGHNRHREGYHIHHLLPEGVL